MSDIICVPLTVSRTGRTGEKRQREEGRKKRQEQKSGLRLQGINHGKTDGVKEDARNEA